MNRFTFPLIITMLTSASWASAEDISAWLASGSTKVLRDAKPGDAPQSWALAAAKNEVESCQLVLVADQPVEGVKVSASPLALNGGSSILQPQLFKVEYVPIKKEQIPYPDPLPPLAGPLNLQPSQAQPVWISVRVPKDAEPGEYNGMVKIEAGNLKKQLHISLKVWNFSLPDTPASVTAFGNDPNTVAQWHGLKPDSPEALALSKKYYEYLLDHRVSSYMIPVDLMSEEAVKYLNDPRMTSYVIPYNGKSDEALKSLIARLLKDNWFTKGFFYVVDEPVQKAAYDQFVAVTDRLRKIEPRYRIIAPFYANPDFGDNQHTADLMFGRITNWCPHSDYLESEPNFVEYLQSRKNAGENIWWYVCNNPREPKNNLQIDQNAMAHRVLLWQQKRMGIDGLLYWHTTYWVKQFIDDPWKNMDTIGTHFYGDGSLLYPGNKVGIDGPVGSIRLEVLRDSLEDFDYLTLADRLLGPEATKGYIAKIARSSTDYERDPARFESVRRELATALEKAAEKN
jgi:hypothetical protein